MRAGVPAIPVYDANCSALNDIKRIIDVACREGICAVDDELKGLACDAAAEDVRRFLGQPTLSQREVDAFRTEVNALIKYLFAQQIVSIVSTQHDQLLHQRFQRIATMVGRQREQRAAAALGATQVHDEPTSRGAAISAHGTCAATHGGTADSSPGSASAASNPGALLSPERQLTIVTEQLPDPPGSPPRTCCVLLVDRPSRRAVTLTNELCPASLCCDARSLGLSEFL